MTTTDTTRLASPPSASAAGPLPAGSLDVARIREDFPALGQQVHGKPLVYLDNAATSQKPQAVLEALRNSYAADCANIHRGVHTLSERATDAYEAGREAVRSFLGAAQAREIVFTRGTTESINLVASTYGRQHIGAGDEVLITELEHHSNIVPWQMLCEQTGAKLVVVPITDSGDVLIEDYEKLLGPRTKLVAVAHISNALGTILPVREMIALAHARNATVLLDGAQAAPHAEVNVQELDCDFYTFSGHKIFGPTGIGVLYGKAEHLEAMPPYQGGGDMIRTVSFEKTTYNSVPYKFEAGTPHIAGTVGLGAALAYVSQTGLERITAYEQQLLQYATERMSQVAGVRLIGTAREKASVLSFVMDCAHPHDVGTILDRQGIAVRAGHHCAMPVMEKFCIAGTTRASFAFYNTKEEVDALVRGVEKVREVFG